VITLVHPYYDHKDTFEYHFNKLWSLWPSSLKKKVEIIIVDDHSLNHPCIVPEDTRGLDLKVLRIDTPILWNTAGAGNLGFREAKYDWVLHADFDLGLPPRSSDPLRDLDLTDPKVVYWPKLWYRTRRYNKYHEPHCNGFLMNKDTFWEAGGFDEDFSGRWGWADSYFHMRSCTDMGLTNVITTDFVLEEMVRCKDKTVQGVSRTPNNSELYLQKSEEATQVTDHIRFEWHRV
jgi:hypothetical protein